MHNLVRCPVKVVRAAGRTTLLGLHTLLGFRRRAVRRETALAVDWFDGIEPDDLAG